MPLTDEEADALTHQCPIQWDKTRVTSRVEEIDFRLELVKNATVTSENEWYRMYSNGVLVRLATPVQYETTPHEMPYGKFPGED